MALIVNPYLLPPTLLSHRLSEKVIEEFEKRDWKIVELPTPLSNRLAFHTSLLLNPDITVIIGIGHGHTDSFLGEDILQVFDVRTPPDIFKDKIVCCLPSCLTARKLGEYVIKSGARAFVGSMSEMFVAFNEIDHSYYDDWEDMILTFYRSLLEGKTVREALDDYKAKCTEYIDLYERNKEIWINAEFYIHTTKANRDYVIILGDPYTKLEKKPRVEIVEMIRDFTIAMIPVLIGIAPFLPIIADEVRKAIAKLVGIE